MKRSLFVALFVLAAVAPSAAQQRPLKTEDPETIGAGRALVELGVEYDRDASFPVSGLRGNHLELPAFGLSLGVSSIAEIQIDWSPYQKLSITQQRPGAPLSNLLMVSSQYFLYPNPVRLVTEVFSLPPT